MANLITLSRLALLAGVVALAYQPPSWLHFLASALMLLVFVSDALDGYVARKRHTDSVFGAMFDILSDRIVELTMWIVLADLGIVPLWVALVFVIRGTIVDGIRAIQVSGQAKSPFELLQSSVGKWLVAGRTMRAGYAALKAFVFCALLLLPALPSAYPTFWLEWGPFTLATMSFAVHLTVAVCVLRGIPVVAEFLYAERDAIFNDQPRTRAHTARPETTGR